MFARTIVATGLLIGTATSQLNPFVFYPQDPERQTITCTSYVGRPNGNAQAEAMMEMSGEHFRGIGQGFLLGQSLFFGAYHWIADEKLSTVETYDIVWRSKDPNGPGPDMTGPGIRIPGLTTPPSTNPNRGTWIVYEGFWHPNPIGLTSADNGLYLGIDLQANPQWPATDGHSLFRADLLSANTAATLGDNERLGAPDPTWGGTSNGTPYSTPWTYILGPLVSSPNLHVGGIDPLSNRLGAPGTNLSMNGLYPDISGTPRCDGLTIRITDSLVPNALVLSGAQYSFQQPSSWYVPNHPMVGLCHLGTPALVIPLDTAVLHSGHAELTIGLPNTIPNSLVGTELVFQSLVFDTTGFHPANWTNAQIVHL